MNYITEEMKEFSNIHQLLILICVVSSMSFHYFAMNDNHRIARYLFVFSILMISATMMRFAFFSPY